MDKLEEFLEDNLPIEWKKLKEDFIKLSNDNEGEFSEDEELIEDFCSDIYPFILDLLKEEVSIAIEDEREDRLNRREWELSQL